MADTKISGMTSLTQTDVVTTTDVIPIVDIGPPNANKKITPQALVGASINNLVQTWNAAPTTFTGLKLNITDTASAASSLLMDLQVGGASKVRITKAGLIDFDAQGTGFYRDSGGGGLRYRINGTDRGAFTTGLIQIFGTGSLLLGDSGDTILVRDAADTLALRRSTNAQAFRVYNTYTDASNYERGELGWSGNDFTVGTTRAGTGTNRRLILAGALDILLHTSNTARWAINGSGHFLAMTDNTYDIGASGANRPRTGYFGTGLQVAGNTVYHGGNLPGTAITWTAAQTINPSASGSRLYVGPGYNGGVAINAGDSELDVAAWTGKPALRLSRHNVNAWLLGVESDGRLNFTQNGSSAFQVGGNTVYTSANLPGTAITWTAAQTIATGGVANSTDLTVGNSQSILKLSGGDGAYAFIDSASWGVALRTQNTNRITVTNAGAIGFATTPTVAGNTVYHAGNLPGTAITWTAGPTFGNGTTGFNVVINGAASGASSGPVLSFNAGGVGKHALGHASAILGGTYDATLLLYTGEAFKGRVGGANTWVDVNSSGAVTFPGTTDAIVSVQGLSGYGAFYAKGSGTNNAYVFFGNSTSGERARISVDNAQNLVLSTNGGVSNHLLISSSGAVSFANSVEIGGTLKARIAAATETTGTLTSASANKTIQLTGNITINNSVFAAGDIVVVYAGAASRTITAGTISTMRLDGTATTGSRTVAAYGLARIFFISATECVVSGGAVT